MTDLARIRALADQAERQAEVLVEQQTAAAKQQAALVASVLALRRLVDEYDRQPVTT